MGHDFFAYKFKTFNISKSFPFLPKIFSVICSDLVQTIIESLDSSSQQLKGDFMKPYTLIAVTGILSICLFATVGCGPQTGSSTTSQSSTSSAATSSSTASSSTSSSTTKSTTTSETTVITMPETSSTPFASLPDIDNPMTDIEPNIPESGVDSSDNMNPMPPSNETNAPNESNGMGGSDFLDNITNGMRKRSSPNRSNRAFPSH